MIQITKEEAMQIRENLRGVNVVITGRQHKSRAKSYYVEQSPYTTRFLNKLQSNKKIEHYE